MPATERGETPGVTGSEEARFDFGSNWAAFLEHLTKDRISEAERSLKKLLGIEALDGLSFLDVGSGSGLFSLAARRLGARVHSFDLDPESVACTEDLRRRFYPDDASWTIERGSILDPSYVQALGTFDVVYSWGVLHHTGAMWAALENAGQCVRLQGLLCVAIYNHQLYWSRASTIMKRAYVTSPAPVRWAIVAAFTGIQILKGLARDALLMRNPAQRYREYASRRGMSVWHDWLDWIGGYPFEVAKPEEIFEFCRARGFTLERMVTCGAGHGCNEFLFRSTAVRLQQ